MRRTHVVATLSIASKAGLTLIAKGSDVERRKWIPMADLKNSIPSPAAVKPTH